MLTDRHSKQILSGGILDGKHGSIHDSLPSLSPISAGGFLLRRPTLKTGRGYGGKKKNVAATSGFSLLHEIKLNGFDTNQNYDQEMHIEKLFLKELQLSPTLKGQ